MIDTGVLTDPELAALHAIEHYDAGTLAEALAAAAHTAAYRADITPDELRQLAALALEASRREEHTRRLPDD